MPDVDEFIEDNFKDLVNGFGSYPRSADIVELMDNLYLLAFADFPLSKGADITTNTLFEALI